MDKVPSSYVGVRAAQLNREVSVLRLLALPVAIGISSLVAAGPADEFARPASFSELFGFDRAQAEELVGPEGATCLANALEDFNLALAAKDPIHAKTDMSSYLTDGGTVVWRSACYTLAILKSLTSYQLPDGSWIHGHVQGPSLTLKPGPKGSQSSPISRTRFVLAQRTDT
jgi:hypothetical protein